MDEKMLELPNSWVTVKLGDFVENEKGKKPKSESKTETASHSFPYVDIQAFEENVIRTWTDGVGCRLCYETDFLMVWDGSRSGLVGKGMNGALGSTLVRIHFPSMVNDYAFYFLQSKYQQINTRAKGVGIPHVDPALLWNYDFPIPPFNEQHRIVAKIEELFSELDTGVESLKIAQAQLKVYRQALLKHAFEGKLTAQWRAENQEKLETADAVLKRIQQERTQRYEQQLADWEAAGKQGSKPKAPKSLPPLTAEELAELPELPEGWGWVKYGDLCLIVRNGISAKPEGDSGTPIFRISAVRPLFFDMADIRFVDNLAGEFDAYYLERGDLVFTRYNGSRHYVGVCAEYRSDEKRLFPDKLVQTRVFSKQMSISYLEKALNSGASRRFIESKIRTTAGQSGVSGDDIKNIPVPICTTDEQIQIVAELESKLSEANQLDQTLTIALQQAEALRQSILKKAFSGQLVAQDPNDEPAAALLARIKAQRTSANQKSALVTRRKRKETV
ncbi:MAG TPA: restriction endonuclease subunit S [Rugosibacter sp.]|nr:restriction endonuclease subunit S [Rugosibacter sp.]HQQ35911.1 restriction endonuclease subunit S [Rugosibacter sp.]